MTKLRLGELFAGTGGLGLAVEHIFDAELSWYAEFDQAPSRIMAHHWPDLTNYGDVTQIDWENIPFVDIISGGSPCQDLSLAGRRRGLAEGTRSGLWASMREGIAIQRPAYVVWENVRGALSAKATSASDVELPNGQMGNPETGQPNLRALGRILGDLTDLGYDSEWQGVRASDIGAPHQRFRVFLIGVRRDIAEAHRAGAPLPGVRPGVLRDPDGLGVQHPGHREELAWLPELEDTDRLALPDTSDATEHGRRTCAEPGQGGAENCCVSADSEGLRRCQGRTEPARLERGSDDAVGGGSAVRGAGATGSGMNWGPYEPAVRLWESLLRPAPSPTEPTTKGRHRLSPAFTEWMMGLPEKWVTDPRIWEGTQIVKGKEKPLFTPAQARNAELKACGNGVVPQQAAHALRIMLNRVGVPLEVLLERSEAESKSEKKTKSPKAKCS